MFFLIKSPDAPYSQGVTRGERKGEFYFKFVPIAITGLV